MFVYLTCINQTPVYSEHIVNLTCINQTPVYSEHIKHGPMEVWFRQVSLYK
jgi:hypothetical protein